MMSLAAPIISTYLIILLTYFSTYCFFFTAIHIAPWLTYHITIVAITCAILYHAPADIKKRWPNKFSTSVTVLFWLFTCWVDFSLMKIIHVWNIQGYAPQSVIDQTLSGKPWAPIVFIGAAMWPVVMVLLLKVKRKNLYTS